MPLALELKSQLANFTLPSKYLCNNTPIQYKAIILFMKKCQLGIRVSNIRFINMFMKKKQFNEKTGELQEATLLCIYKNLTDIDHHS